MPIAFLLASVSLVLFITTFIYPRETLPLIFPLVIVKIPLFWLAILVGSLAFIVIHARYRQAQFDLFSHFILVLFFLPLFIFIWAKMPQGGSPLRFGDYVICVYLLVIFGTYLYKDRHNLTAWGFNKVQFLPALKLLWIPTAIFTIIPLIWGFIIKSPIIPIDLLKNMVLYPFYAFGQLFFFLSFPMARFRKTDQSPGQIVLAISGLFALIHWPNTIVMLICFFSMAIWAWIYFYRPNLFAVAISMGISAAVFGQALPYAIHHNVGVGPDYAFNRLMKLPPEDVFQERIQEFRVLKSADKSTPSADLLSQALNCPKLSKFSRSTWLDIEKRWGSEVMLKSFLRGAEVRRKWPKLVSWPIRGRVKIKLKYENFIGYLSTCEVQADNLLLSGWAGDVKTGAGAKNMLVFINGKLVHTAPPHYYRDDVSHFYPMLSKIKSGFRFNLVDQPAMDIKDVRVFSMAPNGTLYEVFYQQDHLWLRLFAEI
jgi:hypothetical protein